MKTVVSVRLSKERIAQIDAAARQLGMNRSEAINAALSVFPDLISGKCELKYEPKGDIRRILERLLFKSQIKAEREP